MLENFRILKDFSRTEVIETMESSVFDLEEGITEIHSSDGIKNQF